jgi:hypothetical protein
VLFFWNSCSHESLRIKLKNFKTVLRIRDVYPDPGFEIFPSRIQGVKDSRIPVSDPHPHQTIVSKLSDLPDLDILPTPDPGLKQAPDGTLL